jgi:hypothetical protein
LFDVQQEQKAVPDGRFRSMPGLSVEYFFVEERVDGLLVKLVDESFAAVDTFQVLFL